MKNKSKKGASELKLQPLEEVWVTIRWKLDQVGPNPGLQKDALFPIALGNFAKEVESQFPVRVAKKESDAPLDFLPYIPRFQFRKSINGWPLLQLGPGISTLNYTENYSWGTFLKDSLFLRKKLTSAYSDQLLEPESISLKYRSAIKCDYKNTDIFDFLRDKLHYEVKMPPEIPGELAKKDSPLDINYSTVFDIATPKSQAILKIATGYKKTKNKKGIEKELEHIISDIEIVSRGTDAPDYYNEINYKKWLTEAHKVAHRWFLSLVDGD